MKIWQSAAVLLCVASFAASGCGGDTKKGTGGTDSTSAGGSGTSTDTGTADSTSVDGSGGSTSDTTSDTSSAQGGSGGSGTSSGSGGAATSSEGAGGSSGGGQAGSGGGGQPSETYCEDASDCSWGEIDHEILEQSDCLCLFGCAFLPLNQQTVMRRNQQYQSLCDPSVDGEGNPCPIDDCIAPPEPTCVDNTCGPEDPFGS